MRRAQEDALIRGIPMPTELRPLYDERRAGPRGVRLLRPGYQATSPHDINNAGQVVGFSREPQDSPLLFARRTPFLKATLWDGYGNPTAVEDGPNSSDALRINDAGKILYFVSNDPQNPNPLRYFVGPMGAAVALDTLIKGQRIGAIDLNDNDVVLGWRENADSGDNFLYDLTSGELTILPPLEGAAPSLIGVDNAGRVLASVPQPPSDPPGLAYVALYWLPAGGDQWQETGIVTNFLPRLSKTGLVLASVPQPNPLSPIESDSPAGYLDLNAAAPTFIPLPRVIPPYPGVYNSWALDANAAGEIVGQLIYPGFYATLYRPSSGVNADLTALFTPAGWSASNAVGINDFGFIIGNGGSHAYTPQFRERGWILNPYRDARFKDANRRFSELVRILIGITGGGGGVVLPPGGGPIPIDPDGPMTLLDALTPERKDVIIGMLLNHLAGALHDPEARRAIEGVELRLLQKAIDHVHGARP